VGWAVTGEEDVKIEAPCYAGKVTRQKQSTLRFNKGTVGATWNNSRRLFS
jgi:hypothetical protein